MERWEEKKISPKGYAYRLGIVGVVEVTCSIVKVVDWLGVEKESDWRNRQALW